MVKQTSQVRFKRSVLQNFITFSLIIIGVICICVYVYWRLAHIYLSFASVPVQSFTQSEQDQLLTMLEIPGIDIKLPVEESVIKNGSWEVSTKGVSHLWGSSVPGQKGAIIVYGHNKSQILGSLKRLKIADRVTLTTGDGKKHVYSIVNTLTVSPKDTWVLESSGRERLILYTCTGLFDLQRFVVLAEPNYFNP